jgi:hypothetical protein
MFNKMKNSFLILVILFSCKANRREVSIYSKPTVINTDAIDHSQDDLLEWSMKLTPAERDSFVKYFFYSNKEIQTIKETIEIQKSREIKR